MFTTAPEWLRLLSPSATPVPQIFQKLKGKLQVHLSANSISFVYMEEFVESGL